jgi:hypothetical protein
MRLRQSWLRVFQNISRDCGQYIDRFPPELRRMFEGMHAKSASLFETIHAVRRTVRQVKRTMLARKAAPTSPQAGGWPSMIAGSLSGRGRIGPRTPGVEPILGQTLHRGFQGSCGFVQLRICTVGCAPSGRSHMLPRQCRRWRSAGPIRSSALAPTTASRNLDLVFDGCRRGLWLAAG